MAPALAEMLDALELTERVVGVGDYGPWPAQVTDLPGGTYTIDVYAE